MQDELQSDPLGAALEETKAKADMLRVDLHGRVWSMLTVLQHLSADPGGSLSAVAAGRDDARVARITLHAMRAAANPQQPAHRTDVRVRLPSCTSTCPCAISLSVAARAAGRARRRPRYNVLRCM